jgi:hypothetical protein
MASEQKKPGDAVKSYTLVMSVLVVVMGVLYFVLDARRTNYAEANTLLERAMRVAPRAPDKPPATFTELAYEVEQLSRKYHEASGGSGLGFEIPAEMMRAVATKAGLVQVYGGPVQTAKERNYRTVHQDFEYKSVSGGPPEVWRFLTLLYNIESRGRYRVSELNWDAADPAEDPQPPFDLIKNVRCQVALRGPASAATSGT